MGRGGRGSPNKVAFCSLVNQEGLAKLVGVLRFTEHLVLFSSLVISVYLFLFLFMFKIYL